MKNAIVIGILAVFACGVAQATTYNWAAGAVTKSYNDPTAWDVGGGAYPRNTSDCMVLGANASGATLSSLNAGTWGKLYATYGTVTMDQAVTYKFANDNGCTGDLIIVGSSSWAGSGGADGCQTLDIGGNFKVKTHGPYVADRANIIMRGAGVTIEDNTASSSAWWSITVANGASVSLGGTATTTGWVKSLTVNGTITGGTWSVGGATGGTQAGGSATIGTGGSFTGGTVKMPLTSGDYTTTFGGGTYYNMTLGSGTAGGSSDVTHTLIRLKGNINCTNDFFFNRGTAGFSRNAYDRLDTDNGTGKIANITVGRDLYFGDGAVTSGYPFRWAFFANSSTITVGRNATFDQYAYVWGGTSTWNVAGNVLFTTLYKYDNSILTGTTFNINGTGAQSLDFGQSIPAGKKLPLGNLVINKLHGIATLADNVLLAGSFKLQSGGFADPGNYWINMQGGSGTWSGAQTFENDNSSVNIRRLYVKQGSPTWVKLNSNLAISDNLAVDPNCILFTNGFTLTVTGGLDKGTFGPSSLAYTTREGGLILVSGVPEPATLALLGTGGIGLFAWMRRRRMQ